MSDEKEQNPFLQCLQQHNVMAEVTHVDHYRVKRGVAVRTDYIILVQPKESSSTGSGGTGTFDPFYLSKTYKAFRAFVMELKHICQAVQEKHKDSLLTSQGTRLIQYCQTVTHLIESQHKQVVTMNYHHVKALSKQRRSVLNAVLETTCLHFPQDTTTLLNPTDVFVSQVANVIRTFFFTDHTILEDHMVGPGRSEGEDTNDNNPILNPLAGLLNFMDGSGKDNNGSNKQRSEPMRLNHNKPSTPSFASERLPANNRGGSGGISSHKGGDDEKKKITLTEPAQVSQVVPLTRKDRRSMAMRAHDAQELDKLGSHVSLELDDDDETLGRTSKSRSTGWGRQVPAFVATVWRNNSRNPWFLVALAGALGVVLSRAASLQLQIDADWALLVLFAAYCLGLHTPRRSNDPHHPHALGNQTAMPVMPPDLSGRRLLQRTMLTSASRTNLALGSLASSSSSALSPSGKVLSTRPPGTPEQQPLLREVTEEEQQQQQAALEEELAGKPMSEFPEGAELGSVTNCWGRSRAADFKIRGANYLVDKKKIPSKEFLFPMRGAELFLTDTCPENVGSNPKVLNGQLRDVPTFLINFRLPWGVLVLYFEIPRKFVPFVRAGYESGGSDSMDEKKLEALTKNMTPGERCACRFLFNDEDYKNRCFKIVPVIVKGPWVVRSVVGGKPALIGNKVPINYVYEPPEGDKELYWEADLDIAASSAARGILSVARAYTQVLTLDLGFVVQGNQTDELPEQMMVGCRLHGVDPLTAPAYPSSSLDYYGTNNTNTNTSSSDPPSVPHSLSDDGSVTPLSVVRE